MSAIPVQHHAKRRRIVLERALAATRQAFLGNKTALLGLVLTVAIAAAALGAPWLAGVDPIDQDIMSRLKPPSAAHWLGTDQFGRDIFARLLHGARVTLLIAMSANLLAMAIGSLIGLVAGYYGGRLDIVLMQLMDALLALPSLILGLLLVAVLGPNAANIAAAIALTLIPAYARVARTPTIAIKEREFIASGRALGYSNARLMFAHILPNIVPEILVVASLWMASAVRVEASLAFIGLGVRPPTATWGGMIRDGFENILDGPYLVIFPGLAILVLVLALNLLGDGLRDAIDPRLREER
ncbi:MAG: ABC transporter permease [Alphaproteobacteria bacterium]|nr:ABC transporter permease [Alphaproteobacteria bacterium]